jgi:putative chitinase
MMDINKLKGTIPDSVLAQIPEVVTKFGIDTVIKLSHFLAQCAHESGDFKLTRENLNYSAKGLLATFPKYFNAETAAAYQRQPEKIANRVYGGRMGNGPESSGEGYKFRGRGFIQLTGKDNYKSFTTAIGEDCVANPDLVATKYPLASAAWFFSRNCLKKATSNTIESVTAVSKCVNGGTIGLEDRIKHFNQYYKALQ